MKNIFHYFISFFTFHFLFSTCYSQDYLGIANSAFAGVNGIDVNPASIVNNPRKWDVTIIGLNVAVANNYVGLNSKGSKHLKSMNPDPFDQANFLTLGSNGKTVSVFAGVNITLPSFMFTRPKHKDAFAFTCKSRIYAELDGIDPTLADIMINGQNDSALFNQDLSALRISAQAMVWNEYGITYGKTVMQTNNERLNVAGRLKYLQGIAAMYLFVKDIKYNFYTKDSIGVESSLIHYGHSDNLEFNKESAKFKAGGKPSFGLDLGATYEFHPLTDVHSRTKSQSKTTPLQHEYKYKIGLSVQDLGWIKYLKPADARDFKAEVQGNVDFNTLQSSGTNPLASADDSLKFKFKMVPDDDKFRMNLPTLISAQGDYYAGKNIYVNSTFNYAFQFKNNEDKIHEVTTFSITPRWDWKWLGAYVPFSYNKYSHVRAGASLRIGPLIFGTADLLPLLSKRDIKGIDFHFMLKVPHIHFGKKDKKPRSKSKFDVNRKKDKKPKKQKQGKTDMPKKDTTATKHKQPKPEKKKKKEHDIKTVKQKKKTKKHIFPRVHIFKKKNKHTANPEDRDHIIYFKL
ncbi:MAG: hypothetical protein HY841_01770 [Bacteroidetes bacterium]|nr:hypothetical protein [Bacteroidota bacterium]